MKSLLTAAALSFALVACSNDKEATPAAASGFSEEDVTVANPPAKPADGDWSKAYSMTSAGGFLKGNPDAKVKLVEYASLTCHFCADFSTQNSDKLDNEYVKGGEVSWEYRSYIRESLDLAANLVARCGGADSFWGLSHGLFASQQAWVAKVQNLPQARLAEIQQMAPADMFKAFADGAGLYDFAALRGVSREKVDACLADEAEANRLVDATAAANNTYTIPGTPTFIINGKEVPIEAGKPTWDQLKVALDAAVKG